MKKTHLLKFCIFCLLIYSGCTQDEGIKLNLEDFSSKVNEYNEKNLGSSTKAEILEGEITHKVVERKGYKFHQFKFNGDNVFKMYEFKLEKNVKPFDISNNIEKGTIIFFRQQLVVHDKDKGKTYSFLVGDHEIIYEDTKTMVGIGLIVKVHTNELELRTAGSCTCDCEECFNCNHNCGTLQKKCTCGTQGSEATCRACHNATCTPCSQE